MSRMSILGTLLVVVVLAGAGCERRKGPGAGMTKADSWSEEAAPGVPPADDPHAGLAMGGPNPGGAVDPHAGLDMGAAAGGGDPHAGLDMGAAAGGNPGGLPGPDPDRPIDPSKFLRGTLQLSAATRDKLPAAGVVFLAVRPADAAGNPAGAPVAVEIIEDATGFPRGFELTEAQAMIGGTAFSGPVVITARFDQDHDVDTKQPGDLTGRVAATIPATGLVLELDTVLP